MKAAAQEESKMPLGIGIDIGGNEKGTIDLDEEQKRTQLEELTSTSETGSRGTTGRNFTDDTITEIFGQDIRNRLPGIFDSIDRERADISALRNVLTQRGTGGVEADRSLIEPIVGRARVEGERQLGRQLQALQGQAGGTGQFNSLVTSLASENRTDLETALAGLEGQLLLGSRQRESADLNSLVNLLQRPASSSVTGLLTALRGSGGSVKRTGGETGRYTGISNTVDTSSRLLESLLDTTRQGRTSGKTSPSLEIGIG